MADERFPLTRDDYGIFWIKGEIHEVWMQRRPAYCDRGHWIAHVERANGAGVEYSIDDADKWPRYYMSFDRMVDEVRDWLEWREGDGPKIAGQRAFEGAAR